MKINQNATEWNFLAFFVIAQMINLCVCVCVFVCLFICVCVCLSVCSSLESSCSLY